MRNIKPVCSTKKDYVNDVILVNTKGGAITATGCSVFSTVRCVDLRGDS